MEEPAASWDQRTEVAPDGDSAPLDPLTPKELQKWNSENDDLERKLEQIRWKLTMAGTTQLGRTFS